jgi:hypothetical protein
MKRRIPGQELARRTLKKVRRYMLWNCSSCTTSGINANTCKQCFNCGNPKELDDRAEREYRSNTPVNKNYKHRGSDISCQHCGSENKKRFSCHNCGAALDSKFEKQVQSFIHTKDDDWRSKEVQVDVGGYVEGATQTPWNDGSEPVVLKEPPAPSRPIKPSVKNRLLGTEQKAVRAVKSLKEPAVRKDPKTWLIITGVIVTIIAGVMIALWAWNKYTTLTETVATPTSVTWSYSLPLEDYDWRNESYETESLSWSPPTGSRNRNWERTVVRTEDVYDDVWVTKDCTSKVDASYTDTDGTWVEQIDLVTADCSGLEKQKVGDKNIYGRLWTYQQMSWKSISPLTAKGISQDVVFPDFTPTDTIRASGEPTTRYSVTYWFTNHKKEEETTTELLPFEVWRNLKLQVPKPAIVDGFGTLRAVEGIHSEYDTLALQ